MNSSVSPRLRAYVKVKNAVIGEERDQRIRPALPCRLDDGHPGRRSAGLRSDVGDESAMKMWVPTGRSNIAATGLYASTGAVPLPDGDEVTYAYPRASLAEPAE